MPDKPECPTCHSLINSASLYGKQGEIEPGEDTQITDPVTGKLKNIKTSTSGAIPQWTFDPLLTENSFNGPNYAGRMRFIAELIRELQYARIAEEDIVGLSTDQKTVFTSLESINFRDRELLWVELRESTEKILNATGATLKDYFSTNLDGDTKEPGPNDTPNKEEWSIVQRKKPYLGGDSKEHTTFNLPDGTVKDSPSLPARTRPWAILFEDLRHPLITGWKEFWSVTPITEIHIEEDHNAREYKYNHYSYPYCNGVIGGEYDYTGVRDFCVPWPAYLVPFGHYIVPNGYQESSILANPNKFPTEKDIHSSDGGNQYLYDYIDMEHARPAYGVDLGHGAYKIDNTWILFGQVQEYSRQLAAIGVFSGGCTFDKIVRGTAGGSSKSYASARIIADANSDILVVNPKAKSIHLSSKAVCNYTIDGYMSPSGRSAASFIGINHNWNFDPQVGILGEYGNDEVLLYSSDVLLQKDFFLPQYDITSLKDRDIKVKYNSYFKFFVEVKKRVGAWYGNFTFTNIPGFNKLEYLGNLVRNVRVLGYPTILTSPDPNMADTAGFEPNYNILVCSLSLTGPSNPPVIEFIFTDPPSPLDDPNLIKSASGLYGGQTFTFINPIFGNQEYVIVYLGSHTTYDTSICLDDLLYAFSSSGGPSYTSHKKQLPDGKIVENPDGTPVSLTQVIFRVGSTSGWIGTMARMEETGWPECAVNITPGTIHHYDSELEVAVSAVRCEANSKTIKETATPPEE